MTGQPFFLLSRRPGWRGEDLLSLDVEVTDGVLRVAEPAPPSVFDLPRAVTLESSDCRRLVIDADARRVLLIAGTGQVVKVAGPWRFVDGQPTPVAAAQAVAGPGCAPVITWPEGSWQPQGLVPLDDGSVAVLDAGHLIRVLDCHLAYDRTLTDLSGPRPAVPVLPTVGTFVTAALDSGLPGCRWHRVEVAGTVPLGCRVEVDTLTSDADYSPAEVALLADRWVPAGILGEWPPAGEQARRWDALVGSAPGQYLWLRLTLRGDGTATPALREAAVHFAALIGTLFLKESFGWRRLAGAVGVAAGVAALRLKAVKK